MSPRWISSAKSAARGSGVHLALARRASFFEAVVSSGAAGFKPPLDLILRQIAADEDQPTFALLARLPRPLTAALDEHVHALNDEAFVIILHRDDALHPQDVRAEILGDVLDPRDEALGVHRSVTGQRQAGDPLVVLMIGQFV